jgi:mRNA interferase MazF
VKRGEIWTLASGGAYTSKPRPGLVIQADAFSETGSVVVCLITSETVDAGSIRLPLDPAVENGLRKPSQIMIDKLTAIPRDQLGKRIGRLPEPQMARVNQILLCFLGLAG